MLKVNQDNEVMMEDYERQATDVRLLHKLVLMFLHNFFQLRREFSASRLDPTLDAVAVGS